MTASPTVKCPACGTQNPDGSEFCVQCARRLDEDTHRRIADVRSATLSRQATGVRWMAVVVAVAGVLVLVLALVLLAVFVLHV